MKETEPTVSTVLLEHQSVSNSLQFFQWLVLLQCTGKNYGSSDSKTIGSEAEGMITLNTPDLSYHNKCFCCYGNDHHQRSQWWHFMWPKHKPCTSDYHTWCVPGSSPLFASTTSFIYSFFTPLLLLQYVSTFMLVTVSISILLGSVVP